MNLLIIFFTIAIISIFLLVIFFLFAWSAKKSLLRSEAAWSAKNIPIKRSQSKDKKQISSSLLQEISMQTNEYLTTEDEIKSTKHSNKTT
tara:strand:+ start:574 stop:843 length:270 start_codon:yes stop_codon:yes gene_type:complete